ncbi:MAG: hypothetical protein HPY66_2930 [Firmicutes bacterium]|nr:hypothetical protein [Bacillota bacterium]
MKASGLSGPEVFFTFWADRKSLGVERGGIGSKHWYRRF